MRYCNNSEGPVFKSWTWVYIRIGKMEMLKNGKKVCIKK